MKTAFIKPIINFLEKNSGKILAGLGIGVGIFGTGALVAIATPKAMKHIEERKEELKVEKLPAKEILKTVWKDYIPAASSAILGTACMIGSSAVYSKRNTALAAVCAVSTASLEEYKKAAKEVVGDRKEEEIFNKTCSNALKEVPELEENVIFTGVGDTLCYDKISGRYFKSDMQTIRAAENEFNRRLNNELYLTLNELYDMLGLPEIKIGEDIGWDQNYPLRIRFGSDLTTKGNPCIVIDYTYGPYRNEWR